MHTGFENWNETSTGQCHVATDFREFLQVIKGILLPVAQGGSVKMKVSKINRKPNGERGQAGNSSQLVLTAEVKGHNFYVLRKTEEGRHNGT